MNENSNALDPFERIMPDFSSDSVVEGRQEKRKNKRKTKEMSAMEPAAECTSFDSTLYKVDTHDQIFPILS